MSEKLYLIYLLLIILALTIAFLLICYLITTMANKQGRNVFVWLLLSLFVSPILVILCLALLGDTEERRREKVLEEERLRLSVRK